MTIKIRGSVAGVKVDDEGFAKITFDIPSSELVGALNLSQLVRQELIIVVDVLKGGEENESRGY